MGSRGNRRRSRATVLAFAYGLLAVVSAGVAFALFVQNQLALQLAAIGAALGAFASTLLVRHRLIAERARHGEERAQLSRDYSKLTNARVVDNAEFVDAIHRRLDDIEQDIAAVVEAGDSYAAEDAPTVVDLKLRGIAAS